MFGQHRHLVLVATLGLLSGNLAGCGVFSSPRYQGPMSDHFDGVSFKNSFKNPTSEDAKGFWDLLKWITDRDRGPWSPVPDAEPGPAPPERVGPGQIRVTFVNHATTLIQLDGLNILTDPIWSERASPAYHVGPKRVRPPGIRYEDLPPIDVVLLSHNHYDHMDIPTLRRLSRDHRPAVLCGLGNAKLLRLKKVDRARDFDWWQSVELGGGVGLTFVPARHFSSRGLLDRNASLWGGWVVQAPSGRVYFAGDTGFGPHFAAVRDRLGPPDVALLPIGAYRPRWFMRSMHISPAEAVEAHRVLGASVSVAIHFGTFPLADDGQHEPVRDLDRALTKAGLTRENFWVLSFGQGRAIESRAALPGGPARDPMVSGAIDR